MLSSIGRPPSGDEITWLSDSFGHGLVIRPSRVWTAANWVDRPARMHLSV